MPVSIEGRVENGDIPDPRDFIPAELRSAITEAVALLERHSKLNMPIGVTAVGRGSIAGEVQRGEVLGRGVSVRGIIGSPQAHVAVIDRGRRPGQRMPPPDALELWVRRRLGITNVRAARSVAFAIARSIARNGIKGVKLYDRAVRENRETLNRIFDRAGVKISVKVARGRGRG